MMCNIVGNVKSDKPVTKREKRENDGVNGARGMRVYEGNVDRKLRNVAEVLQWIRHGPTDSGRGGGVERKAQDRRLMVGCKAEGGWSWRWGTRSRGLGVELDPLTWISGWCSSSVRRSKRGSSLEII
jgi:hypothetical protein